MKSTRWLVFGLAFGMMAGTGGLLRWQKTHQRLGQPGLKLELPEKVLDFISTSVPLDEKEKGTLPKDTEIRRRLYSQVVPGQTNYVLLDFVLMGTDRTSIHKPQFCLRAQGWNITETARDRVPISQPHSYELPIMKLTARHETYPTKRCLFTYWFVAENCLTSEHWERMWWMAKNLLLTGVLQRWGYVRCMAYCDAGDEVATYEQLKKFLASAVPQFQLATGPPLPVQPQARNPE